MSTLRFFVRREPVTLPAEADWVPLLLLVLLTLAALGAVFVMSLVLL